MTIRQFEYLLAVVQHGSINKAAQALSLTQQSLQAALTSLEKSLGFPVIVRSRSGTVLSPKGQAIFEDVRTIVKLTRQWTALAEDGAERRTTIQISGTVSMVNLVLDRAVMLFREQYPDVSVEMYDIKRRDLMQRLFHLPPRISLLGAITPSELEEFREKLGKKGIGIEVIGEDDYAVILNRRHPLAAAKSVTLEQLAQFTAALYPQDDYVFCYHKIYQYFSREKVPYYGSKQEGLLNLIVKDAAVAAVFPRSVVRNPHIPAETLAALPVADFAMPGYNCLVYPQRETLSPAELALLHHIREVCREQGFEPHPLSC